MVSSLMVGQKCDVDDGKVHCWAFGLIFAAIKSNVGKGSSLLAMVKLDVA